MEKPKSEIAIPVRSSSYSDLNVPGVIVELDAAAAEELGAFEETALGKIWRAPHNWRNVEFFDMWSTPARSGVLGDFLRV